MRLVVGIDPGVSGAAAVYDGEAKRLLAVYPLPNYSIQIGSSKRTRLDVPALEALFDTFKMLGVQLIGIEDVSGGNFGGRKQSAAGAFQFGYTFGLLAMAAQRTGIDWTTASPAVWKPLEKVPREERGIIAKADADFPDFKAHWHGPKGGSLHDRAEAAFLARYFAERIWPTREARAGLRTLAEGIGAKVDLATEPVQQTPPPKKAKAEPKKVTKRASRPAQRS